MRRAEPGLRKGADGLDDGETEGNTGVYRERRGVSGRDGGSLDLSVGRWGSSQWKDGNSNGILGDLFAGQTAGDGRIAH
ncbi:hypothetical protein BaRGS_00000045 [Batillaria attramentaria]|uniref:Uncharacterized protein n=1 Tax=Batillaria attramentaria TaxID=370345 RepID=A0ABD0MAT9_9CAEN